jgi:hypothetical protein
MFVFIVEQNAKLNKNGIKLIGKPSIESRSNLKISKLIFELGGKPLLSPHTPYKCNVN